MEKLKSKYIHAKSLISISVTDFLKFSQVWVWTFRLKTNKTRQNLNDTRFGIEI